MRHFISEDARFKNAQWAVTGFGIECCDPIEGGLREYEIQCSDLRVIDRDIGLPTVIRRVLGHSWADPGLFVEAFDRAIELHKPQFTAPLHANWRFLAKRWRATGDQLASISFAQAGLPAPGDHVEGLRQAA